MRKHVNMAIVSAVCAATLMNTCAASAEVSHAPGTLAEVQALAPVATLPGSNTAQRIEYWSTTVNDAPALASAAVYLPPGQPPAGGWPVVAWAHGTVGIGNNCAYSIAGPGMAVRDWDYLGAWLKQGYAIVASDYVGLGTPGEHPYVNGKVEAHNVVDAVKAAVEHYDVLSRQWVVVGQSQGGGAAVSTARYATEFGGQDLDYRGGVATGVPAYLEDTLSLLGPGLPRVRVNDHTTAYTLYALNGLRTTYPELGIEDYLTDAGRFWLEQARDSCLTELGDRTTQADVTASDLFAKPLSEIPHLRELLKDYAGLPESGYDRPIFLGQGLTDTDVSTPMALKFAATLKSNGEPVTLRVYPTDHNGTLNASLADSVPFVRTLFS